MTDDQISDIASKIYGTLATEQEVRFARAIEQASRRAALDDERARHVGDSNFEGWYQDYAARITGNPKQTARDAYAAGLTEAVQDVSTGRCFFCGESMDGHHEADCPQSPQPVAQPVEQTRALTDEQVEWVVNDSAELGVKIGRQFFWLYKGYSLIYETGKHDDGAQMYWRPVFKREFGECAYPINHKNPEMIGTVSLNDSDTWQPLPDAQPASGGDRE
jgi:hypothetical protein